MSEINVWDNVQNDFNIKYMAQYLGRICNTKGKWDPYGIFSGGHVLVDHASDFMIIKHQVAINDTETAKAKITFERYTQSELVVIKGCHTNNRVFNA